MRSTSSVRRRPPGCSSTCRWTGIPAMASGPTKRACRRTRANARRSPARSARTAISSWRGCRPRTPPWACRTSPPWRRCGGSGSNSITAVPSRGSKRSAGAPGTSNRPAAVRIASPYDLEARYSSKRDTHWVGYKVHLTETCDADHPDLITQVMTTPATTQDSVMGPAIQQDLADRDLLPGTHLLDSGYVDADLLVTAQTPASDRCGWSAVWVLQPATAGRARL